MTLFEYLSVAISIVLALSTAQLLGNLREVFDPARRYWVHALWVVQILLTHFIFWWGFWAYREVESWNLGFFGLALLNPVLLFVCSNVLVRGQPSDGVSWEKHFFSARRWFFVARGAIAVVAQLRVWLLLQLPILEPKGIPALVMILICVTGVLSENKRVHAALALIGLIQTVGVGYFRFQPGFLTLGAP